MSDFQANQSQAAGLYQLALWSAGNLAGMGSQQLADREPFFRRLMKKIAPRRGSRAFRIRRPGNEESLPILADAVIGSSRAMIFSVFGPPGGATLEMNVSDQTGAAIWEAGTWYYPLPQNGPIAMAITFDEDFARCVEFFQMPQA